MDRNRQEQIIIALKEKGVTQPCPRCRNLEFEVIGETKILLTDRRNFLTLQHSELPVILVSCSNCGYITHHATALLGLTS